VTTTVASPDVPVGRKGSRARRLRARGLPYLLTSPAVLVLAVLLAYPLVRLAVLSFQHYGLRQQFGAPAEWAGLANYRRIFADPDFWHILWRTLALCAVCVGLTLVLGMLIALLMGRLPKHLCA
jgi:N,N'-diacetylchitobiose transport system permease protein